MAGEDILVVEDELQVAHLIQHFLTREGYRVQVAQDGRAGRDLLELAYSLQALPDLLILDVHLPFLDGFQLLRHVRDQLEPKRKALEGDVPLPMRVLMLSVAAREEDVIRGLDLGAMDYLPKPFSIDVLCARVKNLLRWELRPLSS